MVEKDSGECTVKADRNTLLISTQSEFQSPNVQFYINNTLGEKKTRIKAELHTPHCSDRALLNGTCFANELINSNNKLMV